MKTVEIDLRSKNGQILTLYIDVFDNSLSRKWHRALDHLLLNNFHLEKNYCWFGFTKHDRNLAFICDQINQSITAINRANLGYQIDDWFDTINTVGDDDGVNHEHMNRLHRYFEDLQGTSGNLSKYYLGADAVTRWHIRQLNLLCHEHESLVLSLRKEKTAPEWQRPSQLMCWLNAPRFQLEPEDYELFGVEMINRDIGGVYVGVNKAVGKHHWEVFNDEGRDSRITELTTSTLRSQTEAAGDFDIEWGQNSAGYPWQKIRLQDFRQWLIDNGFDPEDKSLTIGHPQVAQIDLVKSFGTNNYSEIWNILNTYLDVYAIRSNHIEAVYNYRWSDADFMQRQIDIIKG